MAEAKLEPRLTASPALKIAGLRRHHGVDDRMFAAIGNQWQEFGPMIPRVTNPKGRASFGLCFDMAGNSKSFDYMAGVEVTTLDGVKEPFAGVTLKPKTCAVFQHKDHVSRLNETVAKAWQWLPISGRKLDSAAGEPTFIEYYAENFDPRTGTGDIEVWFPVTG